MLVSAFFFRTSLPVPSLIKVLLLRVFGARIGQHVVIKPSVHIKYPWKLRVGDYSWIGEGVWIDNLDKVEIGDSCCLSQGCYLLTGNHDYSSENFDLMVSSIYIESQAWVGAKSIVCPGVTLQRASVLTVGSIATADLEKFGIYQGNPAKKVKQRVIK